MTAQVPETGVLLALAQASCARIAVRMSYRSWRQEQTERDLDPYGVVLHRGRWYVVGRDHRHDSLRTFRIDRIVSLATGTQTFTVPDGFDPVTHLTSALARVPYRWEVDVLIHGPLDEVARRLPRSAGTLARGMET